MGAPAGFVTSAGSRLAALSRPATARRRACNVSPPSAALGRTLVVGANRGLGLALAAALSASGAAETLGTVRPTSDGAALAAVRDVTVVRLDVRDRDAVLAAVARIKPDVLFSCIGGTAADDDRPDYTANQNLIDAAEQGGVGRFVLLSALGAAESEGSVPFQVMDTMRPLLLDKSRAELYLRESGLEWTIIRPVPLTDDPASGAGMLTEGVACYGTISRDDLAALLLRAAEAPAAARKTLTAIDRSRVLLTAPYVRPLEFWEPLPVDEFVV
jgi:uncharacterized protein YbjT (DUF2867 family)